MKKSKSLNKIAFSRGGVTSATLSRIENGKVDFKFSTLIMLSHTIDIPLDELFKDFVYKHYEEKQRAEQKIDISKILKKEP